jgi:hypothetical protein
MLAADMMPIPPRPVCSLDFFVGKVFHKFPEVHTLSSDQGQKNEP